MYYHSQTDVAGCGDEDDDTLCCYWVDPNFLELQCFWLLFICESLLIDWVGLPAHGFFGPSGWAGVWGAWALHTVPCTLSAAEIVNAKEWTF